MGGREGRIVGLSDRRLTIMSDPGNFTLEKLRWLRQVASDPTLPPQALRLAVVLACDFINRDSREAWPSMVTLQGVLGVKEGAVRRASEAMQAAGHLAVQEGGGRRNSSRYRWIIRPENPTEIEGVSSEKPLRERKGFVAGNPSVSETETPPFLERNPSVSGGKTPPKTEGEPYLKNPVKEPSEGNPLPRRRAKAGAQHPAAGYLLSDAEADSFRALYGRWPKKAGEADARRAFSEVLAEGVDLEAIALGAAAYVINRNRDTRGPGAVVQFTTPLGRWLRERGWETWSGLPDAERSAAQYAEAEREAMMERLRAQVALRNSMPF